MAAVGNIKTEPGSCDLCGGDSSTNYCKQCHQYICDRCKDFHNKVNKGHTLMAVTESPTSEVHKAHCISHQLSAIVLQFSHTVVKLKEVLQTCEEEKIKYVFNRKEIHQRVRQQAHQIKVLTEIRCEELIKETDVLLEEKLSKLAQYTHTVSNQHRLVEEIHTEAINLQQKKKVQSNQVELLKKKFSEMQHSNADPRLRDPLRIIYNDSTPKVEDINILMGTLKRYNCVESEETTDEPPAKRNRLIIEKWGSSWTKRRAEKVSQFQMEHSKTFNNCSYTSIAQNSTGDIFVLDSAHNQVETYTTKGKFLKHFDLQKKYLKPHKLAIVKDTSLLVSYLSDSPDQHQVIQFSLTSTQSNSPKNTFLEHVLVASSGDFACLLRINEVTTGRVISYRMEIQKYFKVKYLTHEYIGEFHVPIDKYTWMQGKAPSDMAVDKEKNVFLLFPDHHCLFGLNSKGKEKFIYGTENIPGTGVGQLTHPSCVCTDNNGDIYIGDTGRIVKIKSDGTFIYHITGVCQPMSGYVFLVDHQGHIVTVEDGKLIKYIY